MDVLGHACLPKQSAPIPASADVWKTVENWPNYVAVEMGEEQGMVARMLVAEVKRLSEEVTGMSKALTGCSIRFDWARESHHPGKMFCSACDLKYAPDVPE
jgi:hypothetical protein